MPHYLLPSASAVHECALRHTMVLYLVTEWGSALALELGSLWRDGPFVCGVEGEFPRPASELPEGEIRAAF